MSSAAAGGLGSRDNLARVFRLAAGIVAFFLAAEFVTRLEIVPPIYLPYASTVVARMAALLVDPVFLGHVGSTLYAWAIGLSIACLIGISLGILIGVSDLAHRM